jgi:integron integrase
MLDGLSVRAFTFREATPAGAPKPRLLDRVREAILVRHYSRRTEKSYVHWVRRHILFHGKRHPLEMGAGEVTAFLTALAVRAHVASSTQNQALSALLFLYREVLGVELPWLDGLVRAKPPQRLPVILTDTEVAAVLGRLDGVSRLMGRLMYGSGLRLLECCRLRVKDVDFAANQIVVRTGKGQKDRVTMLPVSVKPQLATHLARVRAQHQADLQRGTGWVEMPWALARKYPNAAREWSWQWVFPATRFYVDAATGQRRRHHLHESVLQRDVNLAVRLAGITQPASPTRFGTRSRRSCWKMATTSGPCRSFSVTATSRRPRSTLTSSSGVPPPSGAPPTGSRRRDFRRPAAGVEPHGLCGLAG